MSPGREISLVQCSRHNSVFPLLWNLFRVSQARFSTFFCAHISDITSWQVGILHAQFTHCSRHPGLSAAGFAQSFAPAITVRPKYLHSFSLISFQTLLKWHPPLNFKGHLSEDRGLCPNPSLLALATFSLVFKITWPHHDIESHYS